MFIYLMYQAGAHHLDISGEPQYLEKMQLKYHQKAVENGVYVIGIQYIFIIYRHRLFRVKYSF